MARIEQDEPPLRTRILEFILGVVLFGWCVVAAAASALFMPIEGGALQGESCNENCNEAWQCNANSVVDCRFSQDRPQQEP